MLHNVESIKRLLGLQDIGAAWNRDTVPDLNLLTIRYGFALDMDERFVNTIHIAGLVQIY